MGALSEFLSFDITDMSHVALYLHTPTAYVFNPTNGH